MEETGSDVARSAYEEATVVFSVSLAYVEATSALARMRKGSRITTAQRERKQAELDRVWRGLYVHAVDETTIELAAQSASEDALRAYDAVHLAAALAFAQGGDVAFACWDLDLREAAHTHGFALVPESL